MMKSNVSLLVSSMEVYINDKTETVSQLEVDGSYVKMYVNANASCHTVPGEALFSGNRFRCSGNSYKLSYYETSYGSVSC